jgi:hypothetical protein
MDLALFGRVLWRFKWLVLFGAVLAGVLAVLAVAHVSFKGGTPRFTYRTSELWQNNTTVLLTQSGFPEGRSTLPAGSAFADPGRFTYLADLYSQLASGDAVRALIARTGPVDGSVAAATVLTSTGQSSPLVSIFGKSTTARKATALTLRATDALIRYVDQRQGLAGIPLRQRVELTPVRGADSPLLIKPRSNTLPIVVFLGTLICFIALAFILENRRPARRRGATVEPLQRDGVAPHGAADDFSERSAQS